MLEKKNKYTIAQLGIFILLGSVINIVGAIIAIGLDLPIRLNSIGTGLIACTIGPVSGAISGVVSAIVGGMKNPILFAYIIPSAVISYVINAGYKRGSFHKLFDSITVGVMAAVTTAILTVPLNLIFKHKTTGNLWGDALYSLLRNREWSTNSASFCSEFFLDFPDKILMSFILFTIFKISKQNKKTRPVLPLILLVILFSLYINPGITRADSIDNPKKAAYNRISSIYTQTIYDSNNGLNVGEANAIVGTNDGYIWIGTYAGLYRYDGQNFMIMNFDSVKNVNDLFVDQQNRLWIGTNDKGVSIYEHGQITHVINSKNGLPSNSIKCIGQDSDGHYFVGTSSSMCILSADEKPVITKVIPEVIYANNIAVGPDGINAIATNSGDLFFIKEEQIIGHYRSEMEGIDYTSSAYTSDGQLYVSTSSNLILRWDFEEQAPDMNNVLKAGDLGFIHTINEANRGQLWVCADDGIGYIENNQFIPVNTGSFTSSVDSMLKDYQGNLWFVSSRLGVLKMSENSFTDIYSQCNLAEKVVNSVTMWEGKLYSGTDTGLQIIDLEKKTEIHNELTQLLDDNRIRCLFVDSKNNLWISTSVGVGLVQVTPDGAVTTYTTEDGTIGIRFRSTIELTDGTIVAAENTGVDFIKDGLVIANLGEEDGLTNPQILSLIQKDEQTLYAGSDGNGIMVIRNKRVVDQITEEDGLPSGVILRMVRVDDGYVIVTSNSLCYMDKDEKITEITKFPYSNNFDVIASQDGKLWVLGSGGIYIVNKNEFTTNAPFNYELLNSKKGLNTSITANSWNYVDYDTLYFSGNSGVYSINMNNYVVYNGSYRVMVDYIDANNRSQAIREEDINIIPNDMTRLTIRPEVLNYTLNDPYIRYYLEGIDEKEYIVQQSSLDDITYTNLPAGQYVFHLDILDNTGSQISQSSTYILEKKAQFWEHSWFIIYLFFVCIMIVVYITCLLAVLHSDKIIQKQRVEIEAAKKQAEMGNETILAIAKTVDAKDVNTSEHSERVSEYSVLIAKRLGWSDKECERLRKVALLHDIGKIGIPDSILKKPSRLSNEEYAIMKSHVVIGADILKDFTIVDNVQNGVRYHHERYDGSGYVEGLSGEQIPIDARIICIADAFDAMTSVRVYRERMDLEYAVGELRKGRGTQFDPQLIDIMLDLIEKGEIKG